MKRILFFALTALAFFGFKKVNDNEKAGTFKGPEVQIHGGKAWTWVQIDKLGRPEKIGVTLTDKALNSVPTGGEYHGDHSDMSMWTLKFHPKAGITPFNHVGMGWNPTGHEPEPIYGKPHFDFHFYMMTPEEVGAIPTYEADSIKFKNVPAQSYFPANYINPGANVPQMGAHWVDVTSTEFHGKPFTETFIYGSYDGKVTFFEPMITLEFLKKNNNYERAIPEASKFQKDGYYPTRMRVVKHDGLTDVVLEGFVRRTKS